MMENKVKATGLESFFNKYGAWLLVLFSILLYSNTLPNKYAIDDGILIEKNTYTRKGLAGIPEILTTDSFRGFFNEEVNELAGGRYRPLAQITYAIEYQFFGAKPFIGHLGNVLLNALLAWLLFRLLYTYITKESALLATLCTLLFVAHPTHTEAVANIKGRDEILSLLFLCLSLWGLLKDAQFPDNTPAGTRAKWLGISLVSYFLALLSKENGLTFPAIVGLALYCFAPIKPKKIAYHVAALSIVAALYLALRISIVGFSVKESSLIANNAYLFAESHEVLPTKLYALGQYLWLFLYPHPLSWDYCYQAFDYYSFKDWQVWLWVVIQAGLVGYAAIGLRKKELAAFGIAFYFISIFMVSGLIANIGGPFIGDRFLFQGSLGLCLAVVVWGNRYLPKSVFVIVCFLVLGAWSTKTFLRNKDWKDNFTLAIADARPESNSMRTHYSAGTQYVEDLVKLPDDDKAGQKELANKSIPYLKRSLQIYPKFGDAAIQLGTAYFFLEKYDSSEYYYLAAKKMELLKPLVLDTNLSKLYGKMAVYYGDRKEYATAIRYCEKANEYVNTNPLVWTNMSVYYVALQDYPAALVPAQKAVALQPSRAQYQYNLGLVHYHLKQYEQAEAHWRIALRLEPNFPYVRDGLKAIGATEPYP